MMRSRVPCVPAVLLVATLALAGPVRADEPTPLFIADVQFTGFTAAERTEMEGWPAAFAAEVKGALAGTAGLTPMTLENLQAQLGKERLKATFACEDAACLNRIVENFGCSETIFTVVRRIGADKVQVTMDHTAGETVLHSAPPVYAARDFDGIRGAIQELAGTLKTSMGGPTDPNVVPSKIVVHEDVGPEGPPTGKSGPEAPPTGGAPAVHPWVTSPEWLAVRLFVGSHGSESVEPYALFVSAFTLRWRRFYVTPVQIGLAPQRWSSDLIYDVGPALGVPFQLGRDERHEIRLGVWVPLVLWDGAIESMGVSVEALYVYHVHEWFTVHAGVMTGAMLWQFDTPVRFMGGGLVGFGI
ncbi:MAG: hypothetical protein ABIK09_11575 [Pseudomonadota bacterium]